MTAVSLPAADRPAGLVAHPVAVLALVVLVVNDHVLKERFSNIVTGKLSDVAGLILTPLLLVSLVELGRWAVGRPIVDRRPVAAGAVVATGVAFAAVQLVPAATALFGAAAGLIWAGPEPGAVVADPTDLATLPALLIPSLIAGVFTEPEPAPTMTTSTNT